MTSNKYNSDRWERARTAALARDRVCQDCGSEDDLHVHHIRPVRLFDDYDDAHDLTNLVVLCSSCHPKWEGRRDRPNTLDEEGRVQLSQLIHQLSRDTIARLYEPAGPWILYQYFKENIFKNRWRCEECFQALSSTKSNTDLCPYCGRNPYFWKERETFGMDVAKRRSEFLCAALEGAGIPADVDVALRITEKLWSKEEYQKNGWIERLVYNAAYAAIHAAYDPDEVDLDYEPICPLPKPIKIP